MSYWIYLEAVDQDGHTHDVFSRNLSRNYTPLLNIAGVWEAVTHPQDKDLKTGKDLIPHLEAGLILLVLHPEMFSHDDYQEYYDRLLVFMARYLGRCKEHPSARIRVSG